MTEQPLFYPLPPFPWYRWCTKGKHHAPTAKNGDQRKWHRNCCPDCNAAKERARRVANPESVRVSQRKWLAKRQAADPEAANAYQREWVAKRRASDPGYFRAYKRKWAAANRERVRAYQRKWAAANPEAVLANIQRVRILRNMRYADQVCADGFDCWRQAAKRMERRCIYCGATDDIQADHRIPLAKGGPHCGDNCQPVCRSCNRRKSNRDPDEFEQSCVAPQQGMHYA